MGKIQGKRINLHFATEKDMKLVYEMLVDKDIVDSMFDAEHPVPTWEAFTDEIAYFRGYANKNGNYMLIEFEQEVIGAICYAIGYDKRKYSELDIWLKSNQHGKGLGSEAIITLREYVHNEYGVDEFIIRPWIKNTSAIKAYKRCGFIEFPEFDANNYYSNDDLEAYGDGDYGIDGTYNMVMRYE